MQLGKAKKANDFLDSLRAEGEVVEARPCPPDWISPENIKQVGDPAN
jgi:hypothetical protein